MNPPGISITSEPPLWSDSEGAWRLTDQIHRYQHNIEAVGGYWSSQFTIRGGRYLADDWLQDGLGRHIIVHDGALVTIWEGFVNKLTVNYGPLAVTRGPLMDVANRVLVLYSAIEYDEDNNPVVGTRVASDAEDDADSIDQWGIGVKVLSTGGAEEGDAEAIRDTYLAEHAQPETSKDWRSDSSRDTSVTVDCLGYVHFLSRWAYNTTTVGTRTATSKIEAVLAGNPHIADVPFNTDHIDTNPLTVPALEQDYNLAWNVIKGIVARGGTSQERWLFGVYDDLNVYYEAAPTTIEYQQRLSQPKPTVERIGGDEVYPWNVLPGKWLMFPDFLIGQAAELDLKDDPRAMFIERVRFTAPDSLSLDGGKQGTVSALVAQLGLSGIGA